MRTLKPPLLLALDGRLLGVAAGDTEPRLGGWGYDDDVAGASERKAPDGRCAVSWLPWLPWLGTVGEDMALAGAALLEGRWESCSSRWEVVCRDSDVELYSNVLSAGKGKVGGMKMLWL